MYKKITKKQANSLFNNGCMITIVDSKLNHQSFTARTVSNLDSDTLNESLDNYIRYFPKVKRFAFYVSQFSLDRSAE